MVNLTVYENILGLLKRQEVVTSKQFCGIIQRSGEDEKKAEGGSRKRKREEQAKEEESLEKKQKIMNHVNKLFVN